MSYAFVIRDDEKSREIKDFLESKIKLNKDEINPKIVIAVGGDGTILTAVHKYPDAIIFGVHTGHLGFFANYDSDKLDILIDDINNNNYKVDYLDSLEASFTDSDGNKNDFAINEVTILSPGRTLRIDVYIDDEYFERFRGTGLAISTPFGSTAYNKSLNGSVVDTSLKLMQLTEIASINSNAYKTLSSPLVLSDERRIRLEVNSNETDVYITADNITYKQNHLESMIIDYKKNNIKMGYHEQLSFIKRINRTFIISKDWNYLNVFGNIVMITFTLKIKMLVWSKFVDINKW